MVHAKRGQIVLKNTTELLGRAWHSELARLVSETEKDLVICSPFVGSAGVDLVLNHLPTAFHSRGDLLFVTNLSSRNMLQSVTDPRAVLSLATSTRNSSIVHLPGVHAKVYISDCSKAIVTSGNLTAGGLYRNLESGVLVTDRDFVSRLRVQMNEFKELGASIPNAKLNGYCDALEQVIPQWKQAQRDIDSAARQRFEGTLQSIDEDLIRQRLAGGTVSSVFARTIEYLLRNRGPLSTVEIHPEIAVLHPDLCDDTIDRVIDGHSYGKKWKHAVRSAQQLLKSKGIITYAEGRWQLI